MCGITINSINPYIITYYSEAIKFQQKEQGNFRLLEEKDLNSFPTQAGVDSF